MARRFRLVTTSARAVKGADRCERVMRKGTHFADVPIGIVCRRENGSWGSASVGQSGYRGGYLYGQHTTKRAAIRAAVTDYKRWIGMA